MFSISSIQQDRLKREKSKSGLRILRLLSDPKRLIVTILMGNEFVNVSISAVSAAIFYQLMPGNKWAPVLILTIFLLIFGEITPKSVAISRPMIYSRVVSLPLVFFSLVITPIRFLIEGIIKLLSAAFGSKDAKQVPITEAEFRQLTQVGVEEGELEEHEAEMIIRVFDLGETTVGHIMTPRTEIEAIPADTTIDEAIAHLRLHRFSRIPIYIDTIDNIVGVLHANDILRQKLSEKNPTVGQFARQVQFVPESIKADSLLKTFRGSRSHLCIVIDEYGGTAGLVTMDDVLGELFGELHTDQEEDFRHQVCEDGDLIVSGGLELDEFSELAGAVFESEYMETVGGLVFDRIGQLPSQGEIVLINGFKFTVLTIKENRIWRIRVTGRGAS